MVSFMDYKLVSCKEQGMLASSAAFHLPADRCRFRHIFWHHKALGREYRRDKRAPLKTAIFWPAAYWAEIRPDRSWQLKSAFCSSASLTHFSILDAWYWLNELNELIGLIELIKLIRIWSSQLLHFAISYFLTIYPFPAFPFLRLSVSSRCLSCRQ